METQQIETSPSQYTKWEANVNRKRGGSHERYNNNNNNDNDNDDNDSNINNDDDNDINNNNDDDGDDAADDERATHLATANSMASVRCAAPAKAGDVRTRWMARCRG
jgi:hypothetical protein